MARKTVKHSIVNEDEWDKVNQDNKNLYNEFINYLKSTDKSPKTIFVYDSNLKIFFIWLLKNGNNKSFIDIKKRDIINFQNWLVNELKVSPARTRNLRASISSLSNYIETILDDEYPDFRNIINKIPAPSLEPVREKTILEDEQVESLLNKLVEIQDYQKACFIALVAFGGARKSELVQFKKSFFNNDAVVHGMYKTPKIRQKGRGQAGKREVKYVIKSLFDKYLNLWLEQRKELRIPEEIDELFVIKRLGEWKPIETCTIDSWFKTFSDMLNIDIYCHGFRHYFATSLAKQNVPVSKIKTLMNHESSATSEIYIDIEDEENLIGLFNDDGIVKQKKENKAD